MHNPEFPYSVPVKLYAGAATKDASAVLVDSPPLSTASLRYSLIVLAGSQNPQYAPGLYISNGKSWRFIAPFAILNMSVYRGYEINVYADLDAAATPAPSSFAAFRNGVKVELPEEIAAGDNALYVTVRSVDASLDENGKVPVDELPVASYTQSGIVQIREGGGIVISPEGLIEVDPDQLGGVKSVNGINPDEDGNVAIGIGDIPDLEQRLEDAGTVKTVNGIGPDEDGNITLHVSGFQSTYDASTNTPELPEPSEDNVGFYWRVTVAGTYDGFVEEPLELAVGDLVWSDGTSYLKIDNTDSVTSVQGIAPDDTGNIELPVATEDDVGLVKPGTTLTVAPDGSLNVNADLLGRLEFSPDQVRYVAKNGDPVNGDGTFANPFTTIGDAVSTAPNNTVVLIMDPATYAEDINIVDKKIAIFGMTGAFNHQPTAIAGQIRINSNLPVVFADLALNWSETTGSAIEVTKVGDTRGVRFRNVVITSDSANSILNTSESDGEWAGSLIFENFYSNDGAVTINGGYVQMRMAPQDSNTIITVNGGTFELMDVWRLQRVVHQGGVVNMMRIKSIGTSVAQPAIESTASGANDLLVISDVNTWVSPTVHSFVRKTGSCPYAVDRLTRNLTLDQWTGTELAIKGSFDRDVIASYTAENYSGASGQYIRAHLEGIDDALGGKLDNISSATGGTSLVSDGENGVVKALAEGSGINITTTGTVVTIENTGVLALDTTTGAGAVSLVEAASGTIRSLSAGENVTITEEDGIVTISAESEGVTSINDQTGAVTLEPGANVTITEEDGVITISASGGGGGGGLEEVVSNTGSGSSLVLDNGTTDGTARLVRLVPGANVTFTSDADSNIVINSAGGGGGGGLSGVIDNSGAGTSLVADDGTNDGLAKIRKLNAGTGIALAQDVNGNLTIVSDVESGVSSVTGNGGGTSLVVDDGSMSGAAVVVDLVEGAGVSITPDDNGNLVVAADLSNTVTDINERSGSVALTAGEDIEISPTEDGFEISYVGSAAGTRVASLNSLSGDLTLDSDSPNLTVTSEGQQISLNLEDVVFSVENQASSVQGAVSLVSNNRDEDGNASIRVLIPGANVNFTQNEEGGIVVDVPVGGGTVKSVNGVEVDNPDSGNVQLEPASIGAVSITGDTMQGTLNMNGNRLTNLPDPESDQEAVTLAYLSSGNFIIDGGLVE